MKHTYRVTLPDGRIVTRRTAREYTHLVAVQNKAGDWAVRSGEETTEQWGTWGWCGRLDLALKQQASAVNAGRNAQIIAVPPVGGK